MVTSLTLNANQDVSGVLGTADKLVATQTGTTSTGQTTKIGTTTGWFQVYAQGNGTLTSFAGIQAPDGHGWFLDAATLNLVGQEILAGNWQWIEKCRVTAGTATIDMVVRYYKYNAGTYTLIGSITLSAQAFTSTTTTYTSALTALSQMNFGSAGDIVYKDFWINVTTNGTGSTTTSFAVQTCNNAGLGLSSVAQTTTPGYQPIPVISTSPTSLSFSATAGGANPASQNDTLSETAGTSTAWTSNITYGSGSGWLAISPTSGTLAASGNQVVSFTCTTGSLAAGTYTATVTYTATDGGAQATVGVTFVVSAPAGPNLATSPASMWTIINGIDRTDKIGPKSIQIAMALNDPMPTARFVASDQLSQYLIRGLNEVVIIDANGASNPTVNMLIDPNLDVENFSTFLPQWWTLTNTLPSGPSPTITYSPIVGTNTLKIDVSPCTQIGSYYFSQQTLLGTAVPGQTYTFSATVVRALISNSKGFLTLIFTDVNGNQLGTFTKFMTVNATNTQSISGLAPVGTAFATVQWGAQTLATTSAGQFTFSNLQLEPQLFAARGITYPTPVCNHIQANCYVLPSGYTVRQSRLFAGFVSRANRVYAGKNRRHTIECFGLMKLLDSTYISGTYPSGSYTDAQIVNQIISQVNFAVHLQGASIPMISQKNVVTIVSNAANMPTMAFDTISALDALKIVAGITGASLYTDHYSDLHYFPYDYSNAAFVLSDNPDNATSFAYSELTVDEDSTQPKNRVTTVGGSYKPTWWDSWTGDGTTKQFNLTQITPQTVNSLTVASANKKVGINGTHTFSQGYDALLDVNGHFILFNVAPANGSAIVAYYAFVSQVRTRAWDLLSINNTYGIAFDGKVSDNTIVTPPAALQRSIEELQDFANSRTVYHLKTQQAVLPGQLVSLTSQLEGLSAAQFLIQKVTIARFGGDIVEYQIDAGAYIPDIVAILKNLHKADAFAQLGYTNGAAIGLIQDDVTFKEPISFSDSYTTTTAASIHYTYGNAASKYGFSQYS